MGTRKRTRGQVATDARHRFQSIAGPVESEIVISMIEDCSRERTIEVCDSRELHGSRSLIYFGLHGELGAQGAHGCKRPSKGLYSEPLLVLAECPSKIIVRHTLEFILSTLGIV